MPTSTATTQAQTSTSAPDSNTLVILAVVLGGVAVFLIVMLIIGIIVYILCRRKRPTAPEPMKEPTPPLTPEPDLIIEAMPHKLSMVPALTPSLLIGPRETYMMEGNRPRTNLHVFPDAKNNNFTLTMATTPDPYAPSPALPNKIITNPNFRSLRPPSFAESRLARSNSVMHSVPSPIREEAPPSGLHNYSSVRETSNRLRNEEYLQNMPFSEPTIIPNDATSSDTTRSRDNNTSVEKVKPEQDIEQSVSSPKGSFGENSFLQYSTMDTVTTGSSLIMTQMEPSVDKEINAGDETRTTHSGNIVP